jgi:hypothetical protein
MREDRASDPETSGSPYATVSVMGANILEFPAAMQPIVETYVLGGGPFAADASRIKQRRIIQA